jgi:hypothetical protein
MSVLTDIAARLDKANAIGSVTDWADARVELSPESFLPFGIAHTDYIGWCMANNLRWLTKGLFARAMKDAGIEPARSTSMRGYRSMRIKPLREEILPAPRRPYVPPSERPAIQPRPPAPPPPPIVRRAILPAPEDDSDPI